MFIHVENTSDPKHIKKKGMTLRSRTPKLGEIRRRHVSHTALPEQRPSLCLGCGGSAAVCLKCSHVRREQDICEYKRQIVGGIEWLFANATRRAFNAMNHAVMHWMFGAWKSQTRLRAQQRRHALQMLRTNRMRKFWYRWRTFIYKRQAVGALLLAEHQDCVQMNLQNDLLQTQDQLSKAKDDNQHLLNQFSSNNRTTNLQLEKLRQENHALQAELHRTATEMDQLRTQNANLQEVAKRVEIMESKLTQLQDYRKSCFSLAEIVLKTLDTNIEQALALEGHPNLKQTFSKDLLKELEQPEHAMYYDLMEHTQTRASTVGNRTMAQEDRAERILMQWVLQLTKKFDPGWIRPSENMLNLGHALSDGNLYAVLLSRLHDEMLKSTPPKGVKMGLLRSNGLGLDEEAMKRYKELVKRETTDPTKKVQMVMKYMGKALWLPEDLLLPEDVSMEDEDLNLSFLAYLFTTSEPMADELYKDKCRDIKAKLDTLRNTWEEWRTTSASATTASATSASATAAADAIAVKTKLACAHLAEVRNRVATLQHQSHQGYMIWWKAMRIVLRKSFYTLGRIVHNNKGVVRETTSRMEALAFAEISFDKLGPVVEQVALDFTSELKMIREYLETICGDLARIYRR